MKFAIISAGEGSRLAQEGVQLPKPLVQLNGMAMIDRLIHIFAKNGAEEVVVIINNEVALTKEHLSKLKKHRKCLCGLLSRRRPVPCTVFTN